MNLESYFNKLKSDFPDINLPGIFEAEDYNESQLKINGIWTNYPFILQFLISPVGAIPSTDRIFIPFCYLLHSQPTCFFHFLPEK